MKFKGTHVTQVFSIPRAPRWRALLSSLVFAGGLSALQGAAHADTATLTISGTPPSAITAGSFYSFTPTVAGANGRPLSFAIVQKPSWASFSGTTGTLSGTPTTANVGAYKDIEMAVYNGLASAVGRNFSIQVAASGTSTPPPVTPPPPPPPPPTSSGTGKLTISGTPPSTISAGRAYSFTPTVAGAHGRTLSFAIGQKPSWASFSGTTGTLSGTPTTANVGEFRDIEIAVYNGLASAVGSTFSVTVTSSGTSPPPADKVTISGTPANSVVAASAYRFQPTATDSVGKALSYSVRNAPPWASFSIANGALSGTPTSSEVGTYSGIVVSASDGTASNSLPAFAIQVKSLVAATGSATLNWVDPTRNTDGSALTNLAGVNIHYGSSSSNLSQVIQVGGAGQSTYTISNLGSGTWYFEAAAYTTAGIEGAMSPLESKWIP